VTAVAADGTRADGDVVEDDGIARPEGTGFSFSTPTPPSDGEHRAGPRQAGRSPATVGTVHNGFTKLR
jgi:hypothetical protein